MEAEVITTREMRALETNAEYFGVSLLQLMENAGHHVAQEVSAKFPSRKTRIAVFCGLGGNGGDGFVAARHLISLGYPVQVVVAGEGLSITHEATRRNWLALQSLRSPECVTEIHDSSQVPAAKADVVIDALLGTGLKGAPRQPTLSLISMINGIFAFKLAVDIPSGLDSDSGEVLGEAVRADMTATFHRPKPGLAKAKEYVGELLVRDIGLPRGFEGFAGPGDVSLIVKPRLAESHKGDFGRLLVVGGSETYSGAPALVAFGALRTGVDLVYVAAPEKTAYAISSISPDLITVKLEGTNLSPDNVNQIRYYLEKTTAAVVGPGLGLDGETGKAVEGIVAAAEELGKPLLLDADGLKAFSEFKRPLRVPLVLTPHAGEFQVLTGKELPSDSGERVERVKKVAERLNAVVLLKGNKDIVSDGKRVKLNFTGNPGMTVGGTGDVLSGVVGAFLAQGADPFEAAVAGAFVNGAAGDFVKSEKGYHMVATDLLDWIPRVMDDPMSHLKVREIAP
ncbi:MAG: NAD(P)H-hydrate dehydratase [Candidatus Bathyarchaeia archaeon]